MTQTLRKTDIIIFLSFKQQYVNKEDFQIFAKHNETSEYHVGLKKSEKDLEKICKTRKRGVFF